MFSDGGRSVGLFDYRITFSDPDTQEEDEEGVQLISALIKMLQDLEEARSREQ